MPTPMPSASNSCAREKLAIVSFVLASASAVRSGSLPMSVTTRVTTAACRAWSSRIEACFASTCAISWRQHRGQFRGVAGERDQAARHIELAGRQREGVDRAGIEDRHPVGLIGTVGCRDQPIDGLADQRFQLRIVIGAAIGGRGCAHARARSPASAPRCGSVWPACRQRRRRGLEAGRDRRRRTSVKAAHSSGRRSPKAAACSVRRAVPNSPVTSATRFSARAGR